MRLDVDNLSASAVEAALVAMVHDGAKLTRVRVGPEAFLEFCRATHRTYQADSPGAPLPLGMTLRIEGAAGVSMALEIDTSLGRSMAVEARR